MKIEKAKQPNPTKVMSDEKFVKPFCSVPWTITWFLFKIFRMHMIFFSNQSSQFQLLLPLLGHVLEKEKKNLEVTGETWDAKKILAAGLDFDNGIMKLSFF